MILRKHRFIPVALAIALVTLLTLGLFGCASTEQPAAEPTPSPAEASDIKQQTVTPGKFTIATGSPAFEPWVVDDDPSNGKGFEAAVGYAIAEELGFAPEDVIWIRTDFDAAIAPGLKDFDINLQQYSDTPERREAVDFASPYLSLTQALVADAGNPYAGAKTLADLEGAKIAAASGSTSLLEAQRIFGNDAVAVFNSVDDAKRAIENGQADALVTDIASAFYIAGAELDNGRVIGQIEGSKGDENLSPLLAKDSALTGPVGEAVKKLEADGTLKKLQDQWLGSEFDAAILK